MKKPLPFQLALLICLVSLTASAASISATGAKATRLAHALEAAGVKPAQDGSVSASALSCSVIHNVMTHKNDAKCHLHAQGDVKEELKLEDSSNDHRARKLFDALDSIDGIKRHGPGEMATYDVARVSCSPETGCSITQNAE